MASASSLLLFSGIMFCVLGLGVCGFCGKKLKNAYSFEQAIYLDNTTYKKEPKTLYCDDTCLCTRGIWGSFCGCGLHYNPQDFLRRYQNLEYLTISHWYTIPCKLLFWQSITALNLQGNSLPAVPCDLSRINSLTFLDLSQNRMYLFPCELIRLTNLRTLILSQNMICLVLCEFSKMISLSHLDLSQNELDKFPCEILSMPKLQKLILHRNKIQTIQCLLHVVPNLTTLDLSHNSIYSVPCMLSSLTQLISLDLAQNHIQSWSCDLSNLSQLHSLNLSGNSLDVFPCELSNLMKLTTLDLDNNIITSLSCDLSNMTRLNSLFLRHNSLTAFPCHTGTLPNLILLELSYNNIISVPCELSGLAKLSYLYLIHNALKVFPCKFSGLTNLTILDLSLNSIELVSCDLSMLTLLKNINLQYNSLNVFPCKISTPINLEILDLSHNAMQHVKCVLSNVTKVSQLRLSYNAFMTFPCEVLSLSQLIKLDISNNHMGSIKCQQLKDIKIEILDLSYNNLDSVPCKLSNLKEIVRLELSNNIINNLSKGCLQNFPKLNYLDISNNEIEVLQNGTFYDLQFLSYLNMSSNKIQSIELDVFRQSQRLPNLTGINLFDNLINSLDTWPVSLAQGRNNFTADFDQNNISCFTNHAHEEAPDCITIQTAMITMRKNEIKYFMDIIRGWNFNVSLPEQLQSCVDILLSMVYGNILMCDCCDYDIYKHIHPQYIIPPVNSTRKSVQSFLAQVSLKCYKSPTSKEILINKIDLEQYTCNVFTACPKGCSCINSPRFRNLSVTCSDYISDVLPATLPKLPTNLYRYCLDFHHQNLTKVSYTPYLSQIVAADLSYNSISEITKDALLALQNISTLNLNNNKLQRLPKEITDIKFEHLNNLTLSKNSWICDCDAFHTKVWMNTYIKAIKDKSVMYCQSQGHMAHTNMLYAERNQFCPDTKINHHNNIIIGVVTCTFFVVLTILTCIMIKARKWLRKKACQHRMNLIDDQDEDIRFDVFVSYASEDEDYIINNLIPELEDRGYNVCFHRIHFLGGGTILDNISECMNNSKRTLAFFSEYYKNSSFCTWEFKEAMNKDVREGTSRLIIVKDRDINFADLDRAMRSYIEVCTYIEKDSAQFWDALTNSLPKVRVPDEVLEIQDN